MMGFFFFSGDPGLYLRVTQRWQAWAPGSYSQRHFSLWHDWHENTLLRRFWPPALSPPFSSFLRFVAGPCGLSAVVEGVLPLPSSVGSGGARSAGCIDDALQCYQAGGIFTSSCTGFGEKWTRCRRRTQVATRPEGENLDSTAPGQLGPRPAGYRWLQSPTSTSPSAGKCNLKSCEPSILLNCSIVMAMGHRLANFTILSALAKMRSSGVAQYRVCAQYSS